MVILTTCPNLAESRKLAGILLKKRLAACINISSPVESHYTWKGKREKSREYLLIIKSSRRLYPKIEKTIRQNHSYSVPEIIALPVQKGSKDYLKWVQEMVQP